MHRSQQFSSLRIQAKAVEQVLKRRDEQRQRSSQFVADIGKELALDLVKFFEFPIAFLKLAATFVQLVAQGVLPEPQAIVKKIAGNDDSRGAEQEETVVGHHVPANLTCVQKTRPHIHCQDDG